MALTGKQKRVLRSIGQLFEPVVFVGKEGAESAVAPTEDAFKTRELIKVRVLNNAPENADITAAALAERTGGEVAGRVGHTFLLYRPNPELKHRIELPAAKEEKQPGD
jgi:RNA-binding protein